MSEKIKIDKVILVEGKYDKIKIEQIVDAKIYTTNGFQIFSSSEKRALFKRLAEEKGIILMTDSDPAGFVIRNKLKGILPKDKVIHIYSPQIAGKESRKSKASKAGILGVEGIEANELKALFAKYGFSDTTPDKETKPKEYTKADLYEIGLCGRADSSEKRNEFCKANGLPQGMTAGALLEAINLLEIDMGI